MSDIFLGEPPANIKQFIIDNYGGGSGPTPSGHAETWYKYNGDT